VQRAPGFPCALDFNEGKRIAEPGRKRAAGMRRRICHTGPIQVIQQGLIDISNIMEISLTTLRLTVMLPA
jgi:hypothetical protein